MAYYVGVDLGQANDYTAIVVVEAEPEDNHLYVRHIERLPLGTYYPDQVERIKEIVMDKRLVREVPEASGDFHSATWGAGFRAVGTQSVARSAASVPPDVVVDATGVGRPVVDMMRREGLRFYPVLITGGDTEHTGGGFYRVPKRNLVSSVQVALQTGSLEIHPDLKLAETLRKELLAFRIKINLTTSHDSYEAWREGDHDDLVLAVALACWRVRKRQGAAVYAFRY